MHTQTTLATAVALCTLFVAKTSAQSARDIRGASPLIAIENEPPAKLIVDPPLPGPLASGRVFIQYRSENLRVLPVFGKGALGVSPRLGHIHITVDDAPWHFVDASGETIILVGLPPGPHKVLIELADPTHKVITSETVNFIIPDTHSMPAHSHTQSPDPSWRDNMTAMSRMQEAMTGIQPSGDRDIDFVRLMLPHHEAALDMARAELQYGKDPQMRRLAQEIVADQQSEIELMQLWLGKHQPDSTPQHPTHEEHSK